MPSISVCKRLRLLSAGVCASVFFFAVSALAQSEIEAENLVPAEREDVLKCIEKLPPAPTPQRLNKKPAGAVSTLEVPPVLSTGDAPPVISGNATLREITKRTNTALPLPHARIVIYKKRRLLELFNGSTLIKTYSVALGNRPGGHKQNRGDGRTPEGQFYICTRNAKDSAFHIFLGLSYPALPDATRAVNQKIISWRDYQIIRQRLASRGAPLWQTRLGGWVGIHGGSDGAFAARKKRERRSSDWTAGCIALANAEIAELHAATKMGTPVLILP